LSFITGPPNGLVLFCTLSSVVCWRRLPSVVVCNARRRSAAAGSGAWPVRRRPTLYGGTVRLRPVRATPCFACWRRSASVICRLSYVACNTAGGRAAGRAGGQYSKVDQSCYVPLGRHLVHIITLTAYGDKRNVSLASVRPSVCRSVCPSFF